MSTLTNYRDGQQGLTKTLKTIYIMEEWSADNDMPESWWWAYANEDDIFFEL